MQNPNIENTLKDMTFCHLLKKLNVLKKLVDPATKTGADARKTASKRVVKKSAEATQD